MSFLNPCMCQQTTMMFIVDGCDARGGRGSIR